MSTGRVNLKPGASTATPEGGNKIPALRRRTRPEKNKKGAQKPGVDWRSRERQKLGYALLALPLAMLLLVLVVPISFNFYYSLHDWQLAGPPPEFIGIENYVSVLSEGRWLATLGRTILFVVLTVGIQIVVGFIIALILNTYLKKIRGIRVLFLLPMMVSEVVAALSFRLLLSENVSIVNWLLNLLGLPTPQWFGPEWAFVSIVIVDVWQQTPFAILIILAAMQTLPQDVLDAASVDGAHGWDKVRHILIPLLRPAILVVLMFRTIFALRAFAHIFVLTGGGPADRTAVLGIEIYQTAFSTYDIGMASTLSVLLAAVSLAIGYGYIKWLSRESLG